MAFKPNNSPSFNFGTCIDFATIQIYKAIEDGKQDGEIQHMINVYFAKTTQGKKKLKEFFASHSIDQKQFNKIYSDMNKYAKKNPNLTKVGILKDKNFKMNEDLRDKAISAYSQYENFKGRAFNNASLPPTSKVMRKMYENSLSHNFVEDNWDGTIEFTMDSTGNFDFQKIKEIYEYCEKRGIKLKLSGPTYRVSQNLRNILDTCPTAKEKSEKLMSIFTKYMEGLSRVCPNIESFSFYNEAFFDSRLHPSISDLESQDMSNNEYLELLGEDYIPQLMKIAKRCFPQARFLIHEFRLEDEKKRKELFNVIKKIQKFEEEHDIHLLDGVASDMRQIQATEGVDSLIDSMQSVYDMCENCNISYQVTNLSVTSVQYVMKNKDVDMLNLLSQETEEVSKSIITLEGVVYDPYIKTNYIDPTLLESLENSEVISTSEVTLPYSIEYEIEETSIPKELEEVIDQTEHTIEAKESEITETDVRKMQANIYLAIFNFANSCADNHVNFFDGITLDAPCDALASEEQQATSEVIYDLEGDLKPEISMIQSEIYMSSCELGVDLPSSYIS